MAERQTEHRKSFLVLSARFLVVNWLTFTFTFTFLTFRAIVKEVHFKALPQIHYRGSNYDKNWISSSLTEAISDAILSGYLLRGVLAKKMGALVIRDGTICAKNSTFGYFDRTNPITGKGASCSLLPRLWSLRVFLIRKIIDYEY